MWRALNGCDERASHETFERSRSRSLYRRLEKLPRSIARGPPYIKIGQKVLYDVRDLDRWIEERKFKSTADEFSREQSGRKRA